MRLKVGETFSQEIREVLRLKAGANVTLSLIDEETTEVELQVSAAAAAGVSVQLATSPGVGATSFDLNSSPPPAIKIGSIIAIDAYTTQCELRLVTGVSGATITVAALKFAHASGDAVISLAGYVTPDVFALTGDGTDEWQPLQRLLREGTILGLTVSGGLGTGTAGSIDAYSVQQPLLIPTASHIDRLQVQSRTGFAPVESQGAMVMVGQTNFFFTATASDNTFTTDVAHGLVVVTPNDRAVFNNPYGETLPGGITAGKVYYIKTRPTTTTFTLSATDGGAELDVTSDGAGWALGRAGVGLSRVHWESMRVTLTIVDLNGIKMCLQQPSWTRNLRIGMSAAATTQGSAIGVQIGGQCSYHDNIECDPTTNCTGVAIWQLGGAGSGVAVRGFNCNGVNSGDTGMVISGARHSVSDIWTEQCGRAGIELDPSAGGSIGVRGVSLDGYWIHSVSNIESPALLVSSGNCSYALNAQMNALAVDAVLVKDTARSITLRAWSGATPDDGETDHNGTYWGNSQFSAPIIGPVLNNRHGKSMDSNYTVQRIIDCVLVDATASTRTIALPTASNWLGWHTTIVNEFGSNTVVIDPVGAETINGASTLTLNAGESVKVVSDGTNYEVVGRGDLPGTLQTYTVTNPTTDRALNVTADTLAQGLAVLGTLIADLQARKIIA